MNEIDTLAGLFKAATEEDRAFISFLNKVQEEKTWLTKLWGEPVATHFDFAAGCAKLHGRVSGRTRSLKQGQS